MSAYVTCKGCGKAEIPNSADDCVFDGDRCYYCKVCAESIVEQFSKMFNINVGIGYNGQIVLGLVDILKLLATGISLEKIVCNVTGKNMKLIKEICG